MWNAGIPSLVGKLGKSQSSVEKLKGWMKREGSGGQLFSFSQGNEMSGESSYFITIGGTEFY